jgi:hypothetical protein
MNNQALRACEEVILLPSINRYIVSNLGKVWRRSPSPRDPAEILLPFMVAGRGLCVWILDSADRLIEVTVADLVAEAFLGISLYDQTLGVTFRDWNMANCRLDNLKRVYRTDFGPKIQVIETNK